MRTLGSDCEGEGYRRHGGSSHCGLFDKLLSFFVEQRFLVVLRKPTTDAPRVLRLPETFEQVFRRGSGAGATRS